MSEKETRKGQELIHKKVNDVALVAVCKLKRYFDADADRWLHQPECDIEATHKDNKYKFSARNIFDFGLAINPAGGKTAKGLKGGLPTNVPFFIENNPTAFKEPKIREEFMKEHPTDTGWGWDRAFLKGEKWFPMDKDELHVYTVVNSNLPGIMRKIRM